VGTSSVSARTTGNTATLRSYPCFTKVDSVTYFGDNSTIYFRVSCSLSLRLTICTAVYCVLGAFRTQCGISVCNKHSVANTCIKNVGNFYWRNSKERLHLQFCNYHSSLYSYYHHHHHHHRLLRQLDRQALLKATYCPRV